MKRGSQTWVIPFIIANVCTLITADTPHLGCFGNNYTNNSLFSAYLRTLLSSLPSNMDPTGFYNASLGQIPGDRAYAAALCRTDSQLRDCRACVQNATTVLLTWCPNRKGGVLFGDNMCTLRYSDESMFGSLSDGYTIIIKQTATASSPERFSEDLRTLLEDLRGQASSGGSAMKVAAGSARATSFQTVFAFLQCMPDLSVFDCNACLIGAETFIDNSTGLIVYKPSCTLEYKLQPFYNMTRIEEARAMVASPPALPPAARGVHSLDKTEITDQTKSKYTFWIG